MNKMRSTDLEMPARLSGCHFGIGFDTQSSKSTPVFANQVGVEMLNQNANRATKVAELPYQYFSRRPSGYNIGQRQATGFAPQVQPQAVAAPVDDGSDWVDSGFRTPEGPLNAWAKQWGSPNDPPASAGNPNIPWVPSAMNYAGSPMVPPEMADQMRTDWETFGKNSAAYRRTGTSPGKFMSSAPGSIRNGVNPGAPYLLKYGELSYPWGGGAHSPFGTLDNPWGDGSTAPGSGQGPYYRAGGSETPPSGPSIPGSSAAVSVRDSMAGGSGPYYMPGVEGPDTMRSGAASDYLSSGADMVAGAPNQLRHSWGMTGDIARNNIGRRPLDHGIRAATRATDRIPDLTPYINPFQRDVTAATMNELGRSRSIARNADAQKAAASGAFGGSRQGVADALTNEAYDRTAATTLAGLNSQNFTNAQAQANARDALSLQGGTALASMSDQQLQQALSRAAAMNAAGVQQRGIEQQSIDAQVAEFMRRIGYPIQGQQLINQALGLVPHGLGQNEQSSRFAGNFSYGKG